MPPPDPQVVQNSRKPFEPHRSQLARRGRAAHPPPVVIFGLARAAPIALGGGYVAVALL
jgi:hypothetical protein